MVDFRRNCGLFILCGDRGREEERERRIQTESPSRLACIHINYFQFGALMEKVEDVFFTETSTLPQIVDQFFRLTEKHCGHIDDVRQ